MARNFFDNLPSTRTPLTAPRMNALLDGDEPMGNIVVDSIRSKNMFNMKELIISNCSISNSGNSFTLIGGSAWSYASYYVYLKQGNYTISGSQTTDNGYMELYKENTFIQGLSTSSNSTINTQFAISTDGIYEIRCLACQGNIANTTYTNIQLEKGTSATSYSPYQILNFEDTGWQDLTLLNGVTARNQDATYKPQYRKIGNIVYLKGQITIPSHSGNLRMAEIPLGYRPSYEAKMPSLNVGGWIDIYGGIILQASGDMQYQSINTSWVVD